MGGGTRLLTCTRRTRDGIDGYVLLQQVQMGCWQQGYLNASGKATWVGHMLRLGYLFFINLWQTIDVVVIALDTEILS